MLLKSKKLFIEISINAKTEILKSLKVQLNFLNMNGLYTEFNQLSAYELKTLKEINTLYNLKRAL